MCVRCINCYLLSLEFFSFFFLSAYFRVQLFRPFRIQILLVCFHLVLHFSRSLHVSVLLDAQVHFSVSVTCFSFSLFLSFSLSPSTICTYDGAVWCDVVSCRVAVREPTRDNTKAMRSKPFHSFIIVYLYFEIMSRISFAYTTHGPMLDCLYLVLRYRVLDNYYENQNSSMLVYNLYEAVSAWHLDHHFWTVWPTLSVHYVRFWR